MENQQTKKHGQRTRKIAELLTEKLQADPARYGGVQVFYDHGDSSNAMVCQPTSYMGRRYGAEATLSGLDMVLVLNGTIALVVEVEETRVRPKTILGDVFGVVLSEHIKVMGNTYPLRHATMIVAIANPDAGRQLAKYRRLERHLRKYFQSIRMAIPRMRVDEIHIVTSNNDTFVHQIERRIRRELGKRLARPLPTTANNSRFCSGTGHKYANSMQKENSGVP